MGRGRGRGRGETPGSSGGIDGDRGGGELYSLKEIFADGFDPDDFKYGMGTTTICRMMAVS